MKSSIFAVVAGLAAMANAYTKANMTVAGPSGNSIITPAKGDTVPAGKPYAITWTPSSSGTVTIYLCIGLSDNCANEDVPLADKVANSGTFTWNVATSLAASTTKGFGYGIQIISDADDSIYNWSAQFGISNSEVTSASATGTSATGSASVTASVTASVSSSASASAATITTATGGSNSTSVITPTKSMSVPSSLKTTATISTTASGSATTSTGSPASTGAAGAIKVGFGAVVGGFVAALAL